MNNQTQSNREYIVENIFGPPEPWETVNLDEVVNNLIEYENDEQKEN